MQTWRKEDRLAAAHEGQKISWCSKWIRPPHQHCMQSPTPGVTVLQDLPPQPQVEGWR